MKARGNYEPFDNPAERLRSTVTRRQKLALSDKHGDHLG
jgi:hypothetical protein